MTHSHDKSGSKECKVLHHVVSIKGCNKRPSLRATYYSGIKGVGSFI